MINPAATIGGLLAGLRRLPELRPEHARACSTATCRASRSTSSAPSSCGRLFNRVAIGSMATFTPHGLAPARRCTSRPRAPIVAHGIAQVKQTMLEGLIAMIVLAALGYFSWTFLLWPLLIPPMLIFALGIGLVLSLGQRLLQGRVVPDDHPHDAPLLLHADPVLARPRSATPSSSASTATTLLRAQPADPLRGAPPASCLYLGVVPSFTRWAAIWHLGDRQHASSAGPSSCGTPKT